MIILGVTDPEAFDEEYEEWLDLLESEKPVENFDEKEHRVNIAIAKNDDIPW